VPASWSRQASTRGSRIDGLTKPSTLKTPVAQAPTPEIEGDAKMAAREHCLGAPLSDMVTSVYLAILLEAEGTKDSASATNSFK
jgi:hypothetical protein